MMSAFIKKVGVIPLNLGIAVDEINDIKKLLLGGLKAADIILTLGGCSVGEKDYVPEAVKSLGKPGLIIRGIKVQPGRVTSMGMIHGKPILILPGHVQSMLVGSFMLLFPLIRFLSGLPLSIPNPTFNAKAQCRFVVKEFLSFKRIRFVNVSIKDGDFVVEPIFGDSSLTSVLKKADGFIIIDEGKTTIENGEYVNVYTLPCFFSHNH